MALFFPSLLLFWAMLGAIIGVYFFTADRQNLKKIKEIEVKLQKDVKTSNINNYLALAAIGFFVALILNF
jgi:hypothetical protein